MLPARRLPFVAAPCLALLVAACATTAFSYRDRDQAQAMEAVVRRQEAEWNRGDLEAFMGEGYLRSPALTFYSGGDVTRGFDTVLERYRRSYKDEGKEMGRLEFSDVETLLFGPDAGIVRGRWSLEFLDKPQVGGLFTLVMQRTGQGWRIVHDHTSAGENRP